MKNKLFRLSITVIVGIMCLFSSFSTSIDAAAPSFLISSSSDGTIDAGNQVTLLISARQLVDMYAYEIKLTVDQNAFIVKEVQSDIAGFSVPPIQKNGEIIIAHTQIGNSKGIHGAATLSTITLEAVASGEANIELSEVKIVNSKLEVTYYSLMESLEYMIVGEIKFEDMKGHWAEAAVKEAAERGIVQGYGDGTFRPEGKITRAEFITMLSRSLYHKYPRELPMDAVIRKFTDFEAIPEWARLPVELSMNSGIVAGYADHSFRPNTIITRTEATVFLVRTLGLHNYPHVKPAFDDSHLIPHYATSAITSAIINGVVQGKGNNLFDPLGNTTRAEAVKLILSIHK